MDNNSVNKKQYRRLKHYKTSINFYIKTKPRSDLEQKIINNVDQHVDIKMKYKNRGQTKENDIKKIDKEIRLMRDADGYYINLPIHIHHYSAVTFDQNNYLVGLNNILNLEPGSIAAVSQRTEVED